MLDSSATVLTMIRNLGPISRAEIAERARLSPSVVSTVTRALIVRGIVREVGTERAPMGRPSILLKICPEHAYFIGLSLDGVHVTATLADLGGRHLAHARSAVRDRSPEAVLDAAQAVSEALLDRSDPRVDSDDVAGVGVALSGLVDAAAGVCRHSTVMGWRDVAIGPMLEARIGRPVVAVNDADAVAVGERLFGAAQGVDNVAVLSIGEGIGAGIVVSGQLFKGAHGAAGELGHCTIEVDGPACRCGKTGCLEAIASVPAVLERARSLGLDVATFRDLELAAQQGHPEARQTLERAGQAVGLALTHLVNLFSPTLVIVTGSGTELGSTLTDAVATCYARHVMPMLPSPPELRFRHEDGAVWARGAGAFATESFLSKGGVLQES